MTTFANVWIFLFGTAANVIGFSPAYWFECFRIGNNEADSFTNMEEFTNSIKIIALNLISTFVFVMFWNLTLGLKVSFTNRPLLGIFVLNGTSALLHQSLGVLYQYSARGKIDFSLDSANLVAGCAMVGAAAFLTPFIVLFANICLHCIHVLRTEIVSISVAKKK